ATEDSVRIEYALPGARLVGREAIADHAQPYVDALPDCRIEIRSVVEAPAGGRHGRVAPFRNAHSRPPRPSGPGRARARRAAVANDAARGDDGRGRGGGAR